MSHGQLHCRPKPSELQGSLLALITHARPPTVRDCVYISVYVAVMEWNEASRPYASCSPRDTSMLLIFSTIHAFQRIHYIIIHIYTIIYIHDTDKLGRLTQNSLNQLFICVTQLR